MNFACGSDDRVPIQIGPCSSRVLCLLLSMAICKWTKTPRGFRFSLTEGFWLLLYFALFY